MFMFCEKLFKISLDCRFYRAIKVSILFFFKENVLQKTDILNKKLKNRNKWKILTNKRKSKQNTVKI